MRNRQSRLPDCVAAAMAAIALFSSIGCTANEPPYVTGERLDAGLVLILTGIEGRSPANASIREGLLEGGLPWALEIHDWPGERPGFTYAFDFQGCRDRAGELADRVRKYRGHHPGRPVFAVGHSGGGAIGVFLAETLGPAQPLDGLVTLAPALRPEYDLTMALLGSNMRMLNCHSRQDVLLRMWTTVGQNLDGSPGPTAGQNGFALPGYVHPKRRAAFAFLHQIQWNESMRQTGNDGGHVGWASKRWVARDLAPVLRAWADGKLNYQIFNTPNPMTAALRGPPFGSKPQGRRQGRPEPRRGAGSG